AVVSCVQVKNKGRARRRGVIDRSQQSSRVCRNCKVRQIGTKRVCDEIVVNVPESERRLVAHIPIEICNTVILVLVYPDATVHKPKRDKRSIDARGRNWYLRDLQVVLQHSKICW